jgi:hypothetical protein
MIISYLGLAMIRLQQSLPDEVEIDDDGDEDKLHPSLIFAMERTYLAGMNQVWQMAMTATGLMAITSISNDPIPAILGGVLFLLDIVYVRNFSLSLPLPACSDSHSLSA